MFDVKSLQLRMDVEEVKNGGVLYLRRSRTSNAVRTLGECVTAACQAG